jgi:pyruvate formate lyase activating enzyme
MIRGTIVDVQRYRLDDGPGTRTTVFLKGCPLRCRWCANPETQAVPPEVMVYPEKHVAGCSACVDACPVGGIRVGPGTVELDRASCPPGCQVCAKACPSDALVAVGTDMTVQEVLEMGSRDVPFYRESGGGVTISGGEPLLQPEFAVELLRRFQSVGIHTVLDTSGFGAQDVLERLLAHTDLLLYDVKHPDSSAHAALTGAGNERILDNLEWAGKTGIPLIVRYPVIPGVNDSDEVTESLVEILRRVAPLGVELLPYHRMGAAKYGALDREYGLPELRPPGGETLESMVERLMEAGVSVRVVQ